MGHWPRITHFLVIHFAANMTLFLEKRASSFSSLNRICLHGPFVSSEHFGYLLFFLLLLSQSSMKTVLQPRVLKCHQGHLSRRAGRSHQIFTTSLWKLLPLGLQTFSVKLRTFSLGFLLTALRHLLGQQPQRQQSAARDFWVRVSGLLRQRGIHLSFPSLCIEIPVLRDRARTKRRDIGF